MLKLKPNERCPLHPNDWHCSCRPVVKSRPVTPAEKKAAGKWYQVGPGIQRIDDKHHPRGFREKRTVAALRPILMQKIQDQDALCAICGKPMDDLANIAPDHIDPKGSGGAWHDDHESNIQAVHHHPCNLEKGSKHPRREAPQQEATA